MNPKKIIVPIDTTDLGKAIDLVETLNLYADFKIGLEFITNLLVQVIVLDDPTSFISEVKYFFKLVDKCLFYDGKWNDIPNTIKSTTLAIQPISPKFFNVHASSGINSIMESVEYRGSSSVLGVTVLTSISDPECISIFGDNPGNKVINFAETLVDAGAQGIICSPKELQLLKENGFDQLIKVTPGVRPLWAAVGDQKRVMTPKEAIEAGADYLVIGRPITNPPDGMTPVQAIQRIYKEMGVEVI